jgi:hypothetical protein
MCNAANHSFSCDCGFGGDTGGGGGRRWGSVSNFTANYAPPSFGWLRDSGGTVESYVNPNARCPVCGCPVFFYRSPFDGRVFFDALGWPWPKHPCTDNRREPERATRASLVGRQPPTTWRREGWNPLLSLRVTYGVERSGIRGDCDGRFVDLALSAGTKIDRESPVLIRTSFPDLHEVTFLTSDHFSIRPVDAVAFNRCLLPVGEEVLMRAAKKDPSALYSVGRFFLWDLDDAESATPFLEAAAVRGNVEAAFDLLTLALFQRS